MIRGAADVIEISGARIFCVGEVATESRRRSAATGKLIRD
jgi:hypothetical protein